MRSFPLERRSSSAARCSGSIYLTEKRTAATFTAVDEALIGVLAVAAGIAIENARGFERARIRHMDGADRTARRRAAGRVSLVANLNNICADVAEPPGPARCTCTRPGGDAARANSGWPGPVDSVTFGAAITETSSCGCCPTTLPGWGDRDGGWLTVVPLVRGPWVYGAIVIHQDNQPDWEVEGAHRPGRRVAEIASLAIAGTPSAARSGGAWRCLEDRHRIARDLHDHVIQRLFAMGLSLQALTVQRDADDQSESSDAAQRDRPPTGAQRPRRDDLADPDLDLRPPVR